MKLVSQSVVRLFFLFKSLYINKVRAWRSGCLVKVLIISEKNRISASQIFPFKFYSSDLSKRWKVCLIERDISTLVDHLAVLPKNADVIFFQPWFQYHTVKKIIEIIERLKEQSPNAKFVFVDAYAPLDLRFADCLDPLVDFYIKKHIYKDRSRYGAVTQGDSNLVGYYEKLYDLPPSPQVLFNVPKEFLSKKLVVGPSFFTSKDMLINLKLNSTPSSRAKIFGVHARLGVKGVPWYQAMREQALLACQPYSKGGVVTSEVVKNSHYMRELAQSKICFSPFGYGEACWRDYEAILCGALLVKPDMSHVETDPDIFIPYETYIPVAWDFSDLAEKIDYYLVNDVARQKIVIRAYDVLYKYATGEAFFNKIKVILDE